MSGAMLAVCAALLPVLPAAAQIPAFPGAEGFGSHALGGRGGDVYIVSNLNASGAGSFADGVRTAPLTGRTIVFAVSGHIRLPSGSGGGLTVANSKITVAGQTAPGDGICFWNNTMNVSGDDLVFRHLRWRYGKSAAGGDCVDISGSQRLIFDHCDVMFSTDENLSSFGTPPEFFTFQWSVNAWGLSGHSAGGLWDIDHATAHHTLWANNHTRNPKCIGPSVFDWVNNVVFGWDIGFNLAPNADGVTNRVNVRGSTFVHGGSTTSVIYGGGANTDGSNIFKLHVADSALDGNGNGELDVSRSNYAMVQSGVLYDQAATAWPQTVNGVAGGAMVGAPVSVDPRLRAWKKVMSKVGAGRLEYDAARPLRDELTQLCVTRAMAQQRGIISDPLELGLSTGTAFASLQSTTAPADTDRDGMPDYWESALGMNPVVQNHNTVFASSGGIITAPTFFPANTPAGYTHLEEYLHFKAVPHASLLKNTAGSPSFIDIDLRRYTGGFTASPVFTVANVTGGAVTQSGPGNALVRFTPTQDLAGRARFDFTVTDSAGDTWAQTFCLLVSATALQRDLTWAGDGATNPWDLTTPVWRKSGVTTVFGDGDNVTLDDNGSASPALALTGTLQPASVLVDASTKNYILAGPGLLGGAATLTKRGESTLTLTGNNTWSGPTVIENGSVVMGILGTAANSSGTLGSGPLTLLGDASLVNAWIGTTHVLDMPIEVPEGAEPSIYSSRSFKLNGALTGGGVLTLFNQGTTGAVDLNGPWADFAGTLRIVYAGSNGGVRAVFNGGAFNGLNNAHLVLVGGNIISPRTNSGGNTFGIGALSSDSTDAVLGGGSAGAPIYSVGGLDLDTTFAGAIQGNARLVKNGTGRLTLSGVSTHTGTTTVNAGHLAVDGSFGASTVTLAGGAVLSGTTFGGPLTVAAGGIVEPGGNAGQAAGALTAGAMTFTAPVLRLDLSASPAGVNDRLIAAGGAAVNLSGATSITIRPIDGQLDAGSYPLIETTGALTSTATFTGNLVNTPRQTFAFATDAHSLKLVVTGAPVTLAWSGSAGDWDVAATAAWKNGANPDVFYNADAVRFDDSASSGAVNIAAAVSPRSVTVDNTARAFSLGGAAISGAASLAKSGAGTLTLTSANTHTGGNVLNAGLLQLGNSAANAGALGGGAVTLNGGTLRMYSAGPSTHAGTLPNHLHVVGTATLDVAPRCGFSGSVSGAGTLNYRTGYVRADVTGNWSAFTGQLNVTTGGAGDFRIAAAYTWPGLPQAAVNLASGTSLYMSGTLNSGAGTFISIGSLAGAAGSHLRGGPTGDRTLTYRIGARGGDTVFSGDITEQNTSTATNIIKQGPGVWSLGGPCTHRGQTVVEAGTLCLLATGSLVNTSTLDVHAGATLCLDGGLVNVESLTLDTGATFTCSGGSVTADLSNGGVMSVTGGTLQLTGEVTNNGTLRVSGGAALLVSGVFTNNGLLDLLTGVSGLPSEFVNNGVVVLNTDRKVLTAVRGPASLTLTVRGYEGHTYQLQHAPDLSGPWTDTGPARPGACEVLEFSATGYLADAKGYYRVSASP
jgi:autotransporter-associated beta strand protein